LTEPVKPTATFYNNLLGTVNRILEGGGSGNNNIKGNGNAANSRTPPSCGVILKNTRPVLVPSPASRGSTGSYSSDLSITASEQRISYFDSCEEKENYHQRERDYNKNGTDFNTRPVYNEPKESNDVVDVTKKYLQTLGVQFESPVPPPIDQIRPPFRALTSQQQQQQQNYMIQQ